MFKKDVTMIVIAHRLSTVKHADKVIYMKSGKIIGEGNFTKLKKSIPDLKRQAKLMGIR
jgi:ABC-type multidrug transport system fused ATPase/permease subunit